MASKESVWVQWDEESSCFRDVSGNRIEPPAGSVKSPINHAELGAIFDIPKNGKEPDFQKALAALIKLQKRDMRSGTSDAILATLLTRVLTAFETATAQRDLQKARQAPEEGVDTQFNFHVNGYTLAATGMEDEVLLKRYDGASCILKAKSLTDYFDRRLDNRVLTRATG